MTTLITILLFLAGAGWAFWHWYYRYVWAAAKWEAEQQEAKARIRLEARKAHELKRALEMASRYSTAAVMHRAEQLKRQRDGENLIYDDARDKREDQFDEALRRLSNRPGTNSSTTLDGTPGGSPSKEWDL